MKSFRNLKEVKLNNHTAGSSALGFGRGRCGGTFEGDEDRGWFIFFPLLLLLPGER